MAGKRGTFIGGDGVTGGWGEIGSAKDSDANSGATLAFVESREGLKSVEADLLFLREVRALWPLVLHEDETLPR